MILESDSVFKNQIQISFSVLNSVSEYVSNSVSESILELFWEDHPNLAYAPCIKLFQQKTIFQCQLIQRFLFLSSISIAVEPIQSKTSPTNKKAWLSKGQKKLKKRHEKSVVILVLIVTVFVICHSFRIGVLTYQVS